MEKRRSTLDTVYLGSTLRSWSIALGIALFGYLALVAVHRIALAKLKTLAASTTTLLDDLLLELLQCTRRYFLFAVSAYAASFAVQLSPELRLVLYRIFILFCLLQVGSWGSSAIAFWIDRHLKVRSLTDTTIATSIGLLGFSAKFALFALITLMGIHNFGFNITTLLAGLGVGGIAVALAVQNILGDLFASLSIVLDKPFVVGDFIVVEEFMGTIEHIGLKTTRIRSLSGEQLIFSNGDLLRSRVRNFKRMSERRVVLTLSVTYDTPEEKLRNIPALVSEVMKKGPSIVRFERCHFLKFGPSSLDFEVVYWISSPDFIVYADAAQQLNIGILSRFRQEGIEFAFPTQTLHLHGEKPTVS